MDKAWLEQIRTKDDSFKRGLAAALSVGILFVIIAVWVSSAPYIGSNQTSASEQAKAKENEPFSVVKSTFSDISEYILPDN